MCKNKKVYWSRCCKDAFFTRKKRFMKRYLCWFTHGELYIPHKIMIEKMIRSTSNCSNVYKVVDDNIWDSNK
jgi:hypothetical protein